jgi:hypothetical protein
MANRIISEEEYNMIAKKLNDIHDILKEDPNNA